MHGRRLKGACLIPCHIDVYWVTTVFTERGSKREEYFWLFFAFAIVNVFLSSFLLRLLLILLLWLKHFMVSYISFEQYLWFPHNSFYLKRNVHCYSFKRMWIAIARTTQICDQAIGHTINRYSCIKCSCRQSTAKEREREREKTVIHHIRLTVLIRLTLMRTQRLNTFPSYKIIDISI